MALYDSNNELDVQKARERLEWLIKNKKRFELTQKRKTRTMAQNRYLHVALSFYALELGYQLEEFKQFQFKQQIAKPIFEYEVVNKLTGEITKSYKSTTVLDTKEMTDAIDMLRNHASMVNGVYIPAPEDRGLVEQMEYEVNRNRKFLY